MNWEQLLSTRRSREIPEQFRNVRSSDLRSEFEKDYHRIIGSASFRRLQDKTQVFPLDRSDFIRTRLTHSLEVSSFAKSLGQNIGENILAYKRDALFTPRMREDISSIVQCAGLIHDIGNPPFGHFGEVAIREWFKRNRGKLKYDGKPVAEVLSPQMCEDFYQFEGNAQALRLVTKLHFLVDEHGMNLTYALLNTIVKYPVSSVNIHKESKDLKEKKCGYYYADTELFHKIQKETGTNGDRHPLTFILEAADDIAYKTADIEDAFVKGFFSYHQLLEELCGLLEDVPAGTGGFQPAQKLEQLYERAKNMQMDEPEEYAIKNWIVRVQGFLISCATNCFTANYEEIMQGTYRHDLFYHTQAERLMHFLGEFACRKVFTSERIYRMEISEAVMIDYLMDRFVEAVIEYDEGKKQNAIDSRMVSFISKNYKNSYHFHAEGRSAQERLYLRLLLVTDYICGMTDSYAKRLYQELKGIV